MAVLDTSAIMAVLEDEPERAKVVSMLDAASAGGRLLQVPFVVMMEVEYVLLRRVAVGRANSALSLVDSWPIEVVESSLEWRRAAARVKARGGLSVADAWIAALALMNDVDLVHKDPEFEAVRGLRQRNLQREATP